MANALQIGSFEELKHGARIISPIDNEVTEFYIDKTGEKYLASKSCLFPYFQFDASDFYHYNGTNLKAFSHIRWVENLANVRSSQTNLVAIARVTSSCFARDDLLWEFAWNSLSHRLIDIARTCHAHSLVYVRTTR